MSSFHPLFHGFVKERFKWDIFYRLETNCGLFMASGTKMEFTPYLGSKNGIFPKKKKKVKLLVQLKNMENFLVQSLRMDP